MFRALKFHIYLTKKNPGFLSLAGDFGALLWPSFPSLTIMAGNKGARK